MAGKLFILLIILISYPDVSAQTGDSDRRKISLLFIGDIMGHDEQIWSAENRETRTYNYDSVFKYIREEISEADLAFANLEVTLAGTPYTGYPQFSSPPELVSGCINAGIDFLLTANNHSADRGRKGILGTIHQLDSLGIPHTGTFKDKADRDTLYPAIIERNGFKLALLNYTYGTNGIKVPPPAIVNLIDRNIIAGDLKKALTINADAVILFLHWGTEYDTVPDTGQTLLAEYFLDNGADLVIGSHPHVLQKMIWTKRSDTSKDRVIIYSLGNFVSNQRRLRTDGGSMVRIELEQKGGSTAVSDAGYYLTWVYTPIGNYRKRFFILPCSKFENNPDFFSKPDDYRKMKTFIDGSRSLLNNQNLNLDELIHSDGAWSFMEKRGPDGR